MATLIGFADQLRNSLDIVEVVRAYLPLKKRGKEYECVCPFHHEKTPSFKVSPAKQIFHCFGCHKGGDAIRFVQEIEHVDFRAAVRLLAERNGIAVPQFSGGASSSQEEKRRMALYEVHELAARFFAAQYSQNEKAKAYLNERGVSGELIEAFGIGFAPGGGNGLLAHAQKRGYSDGLMCEAGLAKSGESGRRPYDAFRGRVIFPICDPVGRVVAFGGRVLDGQVQPKYLNSPETPIYQKGRYLYAYHLAKAAIKERGFAVITEGYMDAIACHQYGFTNAVASLGTAFTDAMARLLKRLCTRVVFLYDGDEAGQKAMYSGTQVLLGQDMDVRVVALSAEDDPDTLLRREGAAALQERIERAPDFFDYFVQAAGARHDRTTKEGRIAIVEYVSELAGRTRNAIARDDCARRLAEFLAIPESAVRRALFSRRAQPSETIAEAAALAEKVDRHETGLLRLMVEHEVARSAAKKAIDSEWLSDPRTQRWFDKILAAEPDQLALPTVLDLADSEDDAVFLRWVLLSENESMDDYNRHYPQIFAYLAARHYDALTRRINQQILEAHQNGNESIVVELAQQKNEITRKKRLLGAARYGKWSNLPRPMMGFDPESSVEARAEA